MSKAKMVPISEMTPAQRVAMHRALRGEDPFAPVVIPAENLKLIATVPEGLHGSYVKEDGDAV